MPGADVENVRMRDLLSSAHVAFRGRAGTALNYASALGCE